MKAKKIAITIDEGLLNRLDRLIGGKRFSNRSDAVQAAVRQLVRDLDRNRLHRECAKLDPQAEQQLADEGLAEELAQWPEY